MFKLPRRITNPELGVDFALAEIEDEMRQARRRAADYEFKVRSAAESVGIPREFFSTVSLEHLMIGILLGVKADQ